MFTNSGKDTAVLLASSFKEKAAVITTGILLTSCRATTAAMAMPVDTSHLLVQVIKSD